MIARWLVNLSMGPIVLVYRAWGRGWLTDDQCRRLVIAIMWVTLRAARVKIDDGLA